MCGIRGGISTGTQQWGVVSGLSLGAIYRDSVYVSCISVLPLRCIRVTGRSDGRGVLALSLLWLHAA